MNGQGGVLRKVNRYRGLGAVIQKLGNREKNNIRADVYDKIQSSSYCSVIILFENFKRQEMMQILMHKISFVKSALCVTGCGTHAFNPKSHEMTLHH